MKAEGTKDPLKDYSRTIHPNIWDLAPGTTNWKPGLWCSLFGTYWPWPITRPGESPWHEPGIGACGTMRSTAWELDVLVHPKLTSRTSGSFWNLGAWLGCKIWEQLWWFCLFTVCWGTMRGHYQHCSGTVMGDTQDGRHHVHLDLCQDLKAEGPAYVGAIVCRLQKGHPRLPSLSMSFLDLRISDL